jgi:predicted HAD superfamily Cof-like phosphohydrolase
MTTLEKVAQFHRTFGVVIQDKPTLSNPSINLLRYDLLKEELSELLWAINGGDKVAVLDALTDLQYVLDGAYLALGFGSVKEAAFEIVHASNMAKLGPDGKPILRADGKILKPEGWQPPDLSGLIK